MSFFEKLLAFLAPIIKPEVEAGLSALVGAKASIVGDVNSLALTDASAVSAFLVSKLSFGGIFGSEIKALVGGWLAKEVSTLTSSFTGADGAWFDELVAKLKTEASDAGL